jgi:hypothetical protein
MDFFPCQTSVALPTFSTTGLPFILPGSSGCLLVFD